MSPKSIRLPRCNRMRQAQAEPSRATIGVKPLRIFKYAESFATLLLAISVSSCLGDDHSRLSNDHNHYNFCQLEGLSTNQPNLGQLWSAQDVQFHLQKLQSDSRMNRTPLAAYTVAYQRMTAIRDMERCQGRLDQNDPFLSQVNHLLSDIMTRWFVTINQGCLNGQIASNGFCRLHDTIRHDRYDAVSAAMASTAVYLSSHLALSFSAILYVDDFWNQSPYVETHRTGQNWENVRNARLQYLRQFKPGFDRFNQFLADSLSVVAIALDEEGMVNGNGLNLISGLGQYLPFRANLFGKIRDQAFQAALEIAETAEAEDHPMLMVQNGHYRLDYGTYHEGRSAETLVESVEKFALDAVANPLSRYIYRSLLGGKSWEDLEAEYDFASAEWSEL